MKGDRKTFGNLFQFYETTTIKETQFSVTFRLFLQLLQSLQHQRSSLLLLSIGVALNKTGLEENKLWAFVSVLLTKVTVCYYTGQQRIQKQVFLQDRYRGGPVVLIDPLVFDLNATNKKMQRHCSMSLTGANSNRTVNIVFSGFDAKEFARSSRIHEKRIQCQRSN